jgi:hypothetical protein
MNDSYLIKETSHIAGELIGADFLGLWKIGFGFGLWG